MSRIDSSAAPKRHRRFATVFLVIGLLAVALTVSKDYPREQPIVFRLSDGRAVTLTASFTKVGEAEARTGFTLTLPERGLRDVSHAIRVPNGDYIVTVELRHPTNGRLEDGGASSEETSVSRRVSLSGSEVVVPVPARATE